jgi:geranylgeranyl pyrophosphate synthase
MKNLKSVIELYKQEDVIMTKLKSVIEAAKKNEALDLASLADAVEKFYDDGPQKVFEDVTSMMAYIEMAYDKSGKYMKASLYKATDMIDKGFKMLIADMRKDV